MATRTVAQEQAALDAEERADLEAEERRRTRAAAAARARAYRSQRNAPRPPLTTVDATTGQARAVR